MFDGDTCLHLSTISGCFAMSPLVRIIIHEMGDFVILLKSGFDRWQPIKAQIPSGFDCVLGAIIFLFCSNSVRSMLRFQLILFKINCLLIEGTLWVLLITSGAFLYVALVKTIRNLLKENDST